MNKFSELGVVSNKTFSGDKISLDDVVDKEIIVLAYKIDESKYGKKNEESKCLTMSIKVDGEQRVIFCGATVLMDMISKVPETAFPFQTTIIKITANKLMWYKFT